MLSNVASLGVAIAILLPLYRRLERVLDAHFVKRRIDFQARGT
jgi:hypothetical protein